MATLSLYGSSVADATLTTACDMAAASGGVETTKLSSMAASPANNIAEITSQGIVSEASVTAIPSTPTGNGWVYLPGAGTFAAGNWSGAIAISDVQAPYTIDNGATMRFFKYSGGSYSLIGTNTSASISLLATRTAVTIPSASLGTVTFTATDLLYVDLWVNRTGGINNSTIQVYESTTSTAGVTGDMAVTTSNFTPAISLTRTITAVWVTRDMNATWTTRDSTMTLTTISVPRVFGGTVSLAASSAQYLNVTWKTRDEQITWKTRS